MTKKKENPNKAASFPIVGIGASAGGLEAIETFFSNIKPDSNLAFIVVQHLSPNYKSAMDHLLIRFTTMKILQINDEVEIKPNCIYLNQPDKDIVVNDGVIYLLDPIEDHKTSMPINTLFRSLAKDQKELAIGVILSGTGADGTLGVKEIKDYGGMTMAQNEEQAKYRNMPGNAINSGMIDYVLPVEKMGEQLDKYVNHLLYSDIEKDQSKEFENILVKVLLLIKKVTGNDFSNYKQNTIRRRVMRRMAVYNISHCTEYLEMLKKNDSELKALYKDLLIGVTHFFRDSESFNFLKVNIAPKIIQEKNENETIRIWIAGCATGEEAYSIAIVFLEVLEELNLKNELQVFATDMDQEAIDVARLAVYPASIANDISPERLSRFFLFQDNSYRISKTVRKNVVFAVQNIIKDPPFSKLDLLCCRNVLIYMDTVLQKKVIPLFHYTLNPNGFLFLGSSESIGGYGNLFTVINSKNKFFKRKNSNLEKDFLFESQNMNSFSIDDIQTSEQQCLSQDIPNVKQIAERLILHNYSPPLVIINENNKILYFMGNTDKFLKQPPGEPTLDILNQIREDLKYKLSSGINKAKKEKKNVTFEGLQVKVNKSIITVNIHIKLLLKHNLIMITFEEGNSLNTAHPEGEHENLDIGAENLYILTLEQELQSTKEYLQTTVEELETSNEELKSTNEELQSTNEELQSTNEELETSKEEMQSSNEELETVNSELRNKVNELHEINNDLNNLLASTEIGTIFLDNRLCIKRFTPSIVKIFNLIDSDKGRPFDDIKSKLKYNNLIDDAKNVLKTLMKKEAIVESTENVFYTMSILPYRTLENVIDGVVITFVDITKDSQIKFQLENKIDELKKQLDDKN